ncbi:MAG TPA: hypothetical protein PLM07_02535 [Candidatus Rifleibacterium sp.]|nr:hypothetical protein [Candidatus Rifleibacterium sp.]
MNRILVLALAIIVLTIAPSFAEDIKLHPFYEQNGDCYVLVGEGNARAVWALNNLVKGLEAARLYDPSDAYGITAAQQWNDALQKSDKDLYTFAGTDSPPTSLKGQLAPRRMILSASSNVYAFSEIPPYTVHRFHGPSNNSPTGRGNHPSWTISSLFGGIDYPCNTIPAAVATMPGYYWYPSGNGFYHSADVVAWSNWTYGTAAENRRALDNPPPVGERYNQQTDGTPPTRGPWAACCAGSRPGSGWIRGGWVRRMVRENLLGSYRNLKLYKYRIDSSALLPTLDRDVANVLAKVTGTMDMNGECCDGCIAKIDGAAMPGVPSPYLSCIYSAIVNRTYLYRRDQGATTFLLSGANINDKQIGNGGDLTCKFLGISSKNETGNYVYLLGLNQINQWLIDANAPPAMRLNELSDVAVSDQWWQTGGIIYAYDATKGSVYCFVRNESGTNGIPSEINVSADGFLPDKIGADGFGSLYMLRTEFSPADTSTFIDGNESKKYYDSDMAGGIKKFRAEYWQNVYKSVYRRAYDTGVTERLPNRVKLGTNVFIRDYITADGNVNSKKIWVSGFVQLSPVIDAKIRTELAVINSPTPPRPSSLAARTDCVGPMVSATSGFEKAVPDANGDLTDDKDYWFMVENAPYFDANEVNIGNVGEDTNNNTIIGQFPNTIQKSSIRYYWKVIQTHDRFGVEIKPTPQTILDMEKEGASGDYLFLFPPGAGKFKIGVKVTYRYYDYRDLPVGALSGRKGDVLKPGLTESPLVAAGADTENYSWSLISIKQVPPVLSPQDRGVIMSGIFTTADTSSSMVSNFKPGPRSLGYGCNNFLWGNESCKHSFCNSANTNLDPTSFVLDGHSLVPVAASQNADGTWKSDYADPPAYWGLRLRESNYNLARGVNRVASMTSDTPPIPTDPNLIPGSVSWVGGLSATWKSELKRGNEVIIDRQINTTMAVLPLTQMRQLFPVPSEPGSYTLSLDFRRTYRYQIYQEVWRRVGGTLIKETKPVPRVINMRIWSDAQVLVTDNTPPGRFYVNPFVDTSNASINPLAEAYFINNSILYGTTGETLSETISPPAACPDKLVFVVGDNNPLANSSFGNPGRDPYHTGVSIVGPRLHVSHKLSNQIATFSYDTEHGVMPPEVPPGTTMTAEQLMLRNWYSSGSGAAFKLTSATISSESEFDSLTGTKGMYNKSFSYRVYSIQTSDLAHFSRELAKDKNNQWGYNGDWSGRMHPQRANNRPGYKNLEFGLAWREACYTSTNDLSIPAQRSGQIVVCDNDRPNAFISASQDKYVNQKFLAPNNIETGTGAIPPAWVRFSTPGMAEANFNGPEAWNKDDNTAAFAPAFRASVGPVTSLLFPTGNELEVDVPVRFDTLLSDNSGTVATLSFKLTDSSKTLADGMFGASLPLQYVFRQPGRYKIVLEVRDDALGWPANPTAYSSNPPAGVTPNAGPAFNLRKIEAVFDVVPTRLDFRVIERNRTGQ